MEIANIEAIAFRNPPAIILVKARASFDDGARGDIPMEEVTMSLVDCVGDLAARVQATRTARI